MVSTKGTECDHCPLCNKPYRDSDMVECTKCCRWFCYECVGVSDDVADDSAWSCPLCTKSAGNLIAETVTAGAIQSNEVGNPTLALSISSRSKKSCGSKSKRSSISSRSKMKLQLLLEEKELIQKEREIIQQRRLLLDEESDGSQEDLSDSEVKETNHLENELLSQRIEKAFDKKQNKKTPLRQDSSTKHDLKIDENCPNDFFRNHPSDPLKYTGGNDSILTPYQCSARRALSTELPIFNGSAYDWPLFISSYERSTKLCGYDNNENLLRLQKCLRGSAKSAVCSFLMLPECVPQIITTLKTLFGRPEQIIEANINSIRRQPSPKAEKLETLVEFGVSVKNLCVTLEAANLKEYMNNPTLMYELVEKLPAQIKVNWAMYRSTLQEYNGLVTFADWIFNLATNVCTALPCITLSGQNRVKSNEHTHIHSPNKKGSTCKVCSGNCNCIANCKQFFRKSISEKWDLVKTLNLCKLCLKRHKFPCKYPVKCTCCQRKHHPLLHYETTEHSTPQHSPIQVNAETESHHVSVSSESTMTLVDDHRIRFRILPVTLSSRNKCIKTYAFLDEGSSVTLLNENIAEALELQGTEEQLCLNWTGEQKRIENNSRRVQFSISGDYQGAKNFECRAARTVRNLNLPIQTLDAKKFKENYSYLRGVPFKSYQNANPQLLIGLDNWDLAVPLRIKEGNPGEPIAAKCRIGWTVFALSLHPQSLQPTYNYHICECSKETVSNDELYEKVRSYFSIESLGVQKCCSISKELQRAKVIQESTLKKNGSKYEIGLLWKYDRVNLPESKGMAIQRLKCIERKIQFNPDLGNKINEQIEDFTNKRYIRMLTEEELSENYERVWYLPIFPVFNPNKPGKFRLVWDAAASVEGVSLNSMLLAGDDQLSSLLGVLLRFRERKIGFSADIKEMFLQVGIIEHDQHAQRFLWRGGNPSNPLSVYAMNVMTFGATCSPSNAQFVKNTNAQNYSADYPRGVDCILKNHYVDDWLESVDTEDDAITLARQVNFIHSKANFHLRNWKSNSLRVSKTLNATEDSQFLEMNMNIGSTDKSTEKVLGMWWDLQTDSFVFSLRFNKGNKRVLSGEKKPTKREILKILMSIYDPLGLVANFLIYLKILLQEIWRSKIDWDQEITNEQNEKWLIWQRLLPKIENFSIPRCYLSEFQNWIDAEVQLHIFVDASENASATVAYLRIEKDGAIECKLIGAKTRVAPIKLQTIPRLELDGAVLGSRFGKNLRNHFTVPIKTTYYWSDSIIVLNWIRTVDPRRLIKYVSYRVAEIQENSVISNWRYVPTKLNIADEATKWKRQPSLENTGRWFKGPDFLYQTKESWPTDVTQKEENIYEGSYQHNVIVSSPIIDVTRFSDYQKLLKTLAYVYRFINLLLFRKLDREKPVGPLSSEELSNSQNTLVRMTQQQVFGAEIEILQKPNSTGLQQTVSRKSPLYKMSPYMDENGLLRVRGRIDAAQGLEFDAKRPIILPRVSYITFLIVQDFHKKFQHHNHETVINEIRQKFYVPQLRRVLYKVRNQCQMCKIKLAVPAAPEMSPLPECRLATFTAPFTYTGVDYFGPINVTVGRRTEKRWGALFTCLTIRAVHLEVAHRLNVESCILCFKNFMNRRGRPRYVYCDRGTNFIATERVLREELLKVDHTLIANAFVSPEITFRFNCSLSPHMAGAWERLIRAVKISLYSSLEQRTPTDEVLRSMLIVAENIVNSRPLTYLPLDSEESEALTPNHFLIGTSNGDKPMGMLDDNAKVLKFTYLKQEQFANKCWRRFISEYIPDLLLRSKWHMQVKPLKVDDIVIICDKDLPRGNWPKGRIIEVKTASDGQVRRAKVQTSHGVLDRPAVKLAVLRVKGEDGTDLHSGSPVPGGSVKRSC